MFANGFEPIAVTRSYNQDAYQRYERILRCLATSNAAQVLDVTEHNSNDDLVFAQQIFVDITKSDPADSVSALRPARGQGHGEIKNGIRHRRLTAMFDVDQETYGAIGLQYDSTQQPPVLKVIATEVHNSALIHSLL